MYKYTQPWYTTLSIFNQSLVCLPTCRFISLLLIVKTQREVFQCKIMVLPHIVNSQNQIPFLTLLFFSVLWFWGTLNVKQKQLLRKLPLASASWSCVLFRLSTFHKSLQTASRNQERSFMLCFLLCTLNIVNDFGVWTISAAKQVSSFSIPF